LLQQYIGEEDNIAQLEQGKITRIRRPPDGTRNEGKREAPHENRRKNAMGAGWIASTGKHLLLIESGRATSVSDTTHRTSKAGGGCQEAAKNTPVQEGVEEEGERGGDEWLCTSVGEKRVLDRRSMGRRRRGRGRAGAKGGGEATQVQSNHQLPRAIMGSGAGWHRACRQRKGVNNVERGAEAGIPESATGNGVDPASATPWGRVVAIVRGLAGSSVGKLTSFFS
jgi:hypothetical protein